MKRPNPVSVAAHWGAAWAMLLALYFGLDAVYGGGQRGAAFLAHAYAGLAVLGIAVVRLFLRALFPWPEEEGPRIAALAASAAHWALYGMMLLVPLTGWIVASAMGCCRAVPGLLDIDRLAAGVGDATPVDAGAAYRVHVVFVWALLALIALHVLAALYHHVIARDATLRRMLPIPMRRRDRKRRPAP